MLHSIAKRLSQRNRPGGTERRSIQLNSLESRIVFNAEMALDVSASDSDGTWYEPPVIESNTVEQLAFDGAEGMGRFAKGGRGGDVYHVTNLQDDGEGSLRHGIESMTGPRTIVFDVSGTIFLNSRLTVDTPYLTIAGQTAPGDGIAIANHTFQIHNTHDIIVRYIRTRAGDLDISNTSPDTHDTFAIRWSHDVIVDHVSMSWSTDETLATYQSENITIQWSIISESLSDSYHSKGPHGYASLNWGGSISLHHNLISHHDYRMPKLKDITAEVVNNIFYDWGRSYPSNVGDVEGTLPSQVNFVNNLYLAGDSANTGLPTNIPYWGRDASEIWTSGNLTDANHNGVLDPIASDFTLHPTTVSNFVASPFDFSGLEAEPTMEAYESVLASAGASLSRDAVDARVVQQVREQNGNIIDSQSDVGGFPLLQSDAAAIDSDQDGIPDAWELANSLDPTDGTDATLDSNGDGFTNLEAYLHWILAPESFTVSQSTVALEQGAEYRFSVAAIAKPSDSVFEYQIDWNGDGVVDQRINASLDVPISHVFKDGQYEVQVTVLGEGEAFTFSELIVVDSLQGDDDSPPDTTTLSSTIVGGEDPLRQPGDAVTIELFNPTNEEIGIDWNGDGKVDQTTSGTSVLQHFYQNAGAYEIFVFTSNGDLFSTHTIEVQEDEETLSVPPPVPLPVGGD